MAHESTQTAHIYEHADPALKEQAIARTAPLGATPVDTGHPTNSSRSSKRCNYVKRPICETPTQQGKTGTQQPVFNITMRGT